MDEIEQINVEDMRSRIASGTIFVLDVRRHTGGSQIDGAVRYDPHKLETAARLSLPLPKGDGLIVIYGDNDSERIAQKLQSQGYGRVALLRGGFDAWKAAGAPVSEETLEQVVPTISEQQPER